MITYKSAGKFLLLLVGLSVGSIKLFGSVAATVNSAQDGIWKGLTEPVLGMHHLLFSLMAGLLAFTMTKRPKSPLIYLVALIPGYMLQWLQPLPALPIDLAVAVSVAVLLLMLWFHVKTARFSPAVFLVGGILHGLSLAKAVQGSSLTGFVSYALTATLVQGLVCFGFGSFALSVSQRSPDGFEGLENILSATATGVALAYFVMAF